MSMTQIFQGPTGRKRLLKTTKQSDINCFDDLLYCCAVTVEDAMLTSGATPVLDYSRLDLFKLAMPLARDMRTEHTAITTAVGNSHPSAGLKPDQIKTQTSMHMQGIGPEVIEALKAYGQPMSSQKLYAIFTGRAGKASGQAAIQALHDLYAAGTVEKAGGWPEYTVTHWQLSGARP